MADTGVRTLTRRVARRVRLVLQPDHTINHVDILVCRTPPIGIAPATPMSVQPMSPGPMSPGPMSPGPMSPEPMSAITALAIERARNRLVDRASATDRRAIATTTPTVSVHREGWIDGTGPSSGRRTLRLFLADGCEPSDDALADLVEVFDRRPDLDLAYGDSGGDEPRLLPGFSPERLADQFYLGQLIAVRADRLVLGDGAVGVTLAASIGPGSVVAHLPWSLHRPAPGSPDADQGSAWSGYEAGWNLRPRPPRSWPSASVVIPTRGAGRGLVRGPTVLVEQAVASVVARSTYPRLELVVVTTPGTPEELTNRLRTIVATAGPSRSIDLRFVHDERPFNFSNACNRGAVTSSGELLVFLNDDTEVLTDDWLEQLAAHAVRPDIGAVGAKLFYEDGRVQHCGIWSRGGHPVHRYEGWDGNSGGYLGALAVAQNCLAVTGACLVVERDKFVSVGGFSPVFPNSYNDVDLCLKLLERGLRTVVEPRSRLRHHEASTRDPSITDQDLVTLHDRWRHRLNNDPFDNPRHRAERSEEWPPPDNEPGRDERPPVRFWPLEPMMPAVAGVLRSPG